MKRLVTIASLLFALVPGASTAANLPIGNTDAWFDDRLVTVAVAGSFGDAADDSTTHVVYTSSVRLPGGEEPFMPVLETLPGMMDDHVAWAEVDVFFKPGITPRQFTSSAEVLTAMASGDVVLVPTGTRYAITLIDTGTDGEPGHRRVPGDMLKPIAVDSERASWSRVKRLING
jgi:hypothetical protein